MTIPQATYVLSARPAGHVWHVICCKRILVALNVDESSGQLLEQHVPFSVEPQNTVSEPALHVDAGCARQRVELVLRLWVQALPPRLQGVGPEQAVGGMQGATLGAQVLGGVVGFCRCTITVVSKEGLGQWLHDCMPRSGL